jgi:hypothetical protein
MFAWLRKIKFIGSILYNKIKHRELHDSEIYLTGKIFFVGRKRKNGMRQFYTEVVNQYNHKTFMSIDVDAVGSEENKIPLFPGVVFVWRTKCVDNEVISKFNFYLPKQYTERLTNYDLN